MPPSPSNESLSVDASTFHHEHPPTTPNQCSPLSPINLFKFKDTGPNFAWMDLWRPWSSLHKEVISKEDKLKKRFPITFFRWNKQNFYKKKGLIYRVEQEPIQKQFVTMSPTPWMRYNYQHTPSEAYKALPADVMDSLDIFLERDLSIKPREDATLLDSFWNSTNQVSTP